MQLLQLLEIPDTLSGPEKLARLRQVSADLLVETVMRLDLYTFRPCNDGAFFREWSGAQSLADSSATGRGWLTDGRLESAVKERSMDVYIGETMHEVRFGVH